TPSVVPTSSNPRPVLGEANTGTSAPTLTFCPTSPVAASNSTSVELPQSSAQTSPPMTIGALSAPSSRGPTFRAATSTTCSPPPRPADPRKETWSVGSATDAPTSQPL